VTGSASRLVALHEVRKGHGSGAGRVESLRGLDLVIEPGEVIALLGPSGSGKSSVLQLLCEWEAPDGGSIEWGPDLAVDARRRHRLSVVPQGLGLLDELSVRENVELPGRLGGTVVGVDRALADLGLAEIAGRRPSECSLGEQQRAAVARAVVVSPLLLLADEPTSNQDEGSAALVLDELVRCAERGAGCLIATHAAAVAARADRVVQLREGRAV
jgi:putative ABC transport system ATP-binding protein